MAKRRSSRKKSKSSKKKPLCTSGKSFPCGFSCQPIEKNGKKVKCRSNVDEKGNKVVEDFAQFLSRRNEESDIKKAKAETSAAAEDLIRSIAQGNDAFAKEIRKRMNEIDEKNKNDG